MAVVLVALAVVEVLTRVKLFHVSKDFRDYLSYPGRAAALAGAGGIRVAVLGNSVAHEGIDPGVLADAIRGQGATPAHADVFSADHSYVTTWRYVLERYFLRPGNHVDLVLVPFWGDNLYDGNEIELGRLAQFFTTVGDWPEVLRADLDSNGERLDFLVSGVWATWAARDRMQQWFFTHTLPDFRGVLLVQEGVIIEHETIANASRPRRQRPARTFRRLLRTAREHGTVLCFVAVPTLHPEWNDSYAPLVRLMTLAGMHYLDLRQMAGLSVRSYVDRVHMNADGRAFFSRRLGEALTPLLQCEGANCPVRASVPARTPGPTTVADQRP